ncbi:hypothetical protein [Tenacibaculum sediminilitoris]|uniref:hypothetical protein n=1 Tax=Tenacibaculum sediminilitoris TaxID=1820334 RepID=UPI0038B59E5F
MSQLKKIFLFLFLYLIPFPLFIMPSGSIFQGKSTDEDAFSLPISLIILIFVYIINPKYINNIFKGHKAFLFFIVISLISFLLTVFRSNDFNSLLLIISILPVVLSYGIGVEVLKKTNLDLFFLPNLVSDFIKITFFICLLHIISSFINFGISGSFAVRGDDGFFGLFSIYQKVTYYPTVISVVFIFALYSNFKTKYLICSVIFLNIMIIGSRESMVMCLFGLFSVLYYNRLKKKNIKNLFYLILISLSSLFLMLNSEKISFENEFVFVRKINNLIAKGDYTAGREGAIFEVFSESGDDFNLLVGTGYSMTLGDFRSPHNQYLEIFLRSGIIGLVFFMLVVFFALKAIYLIVKKNRFNKFFETYYSISVGFLAILLLSFNINTPIRTPFSSIFVGLLLGIILNLKFDYKSGKLLN